MNEKKNLNEGNRIHNFILCVCENFCDTILLRFRRFDKLRFRFLFHTAKSYGSYGSGSGSTTLQAAPNLNNEKILLLLLLGTKRQQEN
jgi:hypothetical protein